MKGFIPHSMLARFLKWPGIILISTQLLACIEYDISGTLDQNGINVECRDGVDNDKDGWLDAEDPDCAARIAITELGFGSSVCNDGLDNDGDTAIDAADEHCLNALSQHESSLTGDVLITEFMANPLAKTDAYGEWIELYNNTAVAVDIKNWILQDAVGSHVIASALIIPAKSYRVISRASSALNGLPLEFPTDYVYGSGISLSNTGDSITLLDPSGVVVAAVNFGGDKVLEGSSTIVSGALFDANATVLVDQQQAQNTANWCFSKVAMADAGSDNGSPGQANPVCL